MNADAKSTSQSTSQSTPAEPVAAVEVVQRRRSSARKLQAIVGAVATLIVTSGVIVWAVANLILNLMAFREADQLGLWWVSAPILLGLCGIPLVWALVRLFRVLGPQDASSTS